MSHTSIETLAAAAYARLTATRLERAISVARLINPTAKANRYDACVSPCFELLELTDHLDAKREAREQHDACARFKAQQARRFMEDQMIERAVARQPGIAA